jgi:hypothetical protein
LITAAVAPRSPGSSGYVAVLTGALLVLVVAALAVMLIADLSAVDALTALLIPLLGPARELIEMIRNNRDRAVAKAKADFKVHDLWRNGLQGKQITTAACRSVQDQILVIRLTNAHVPDWLDALQRRRNEQRGTHAAERHAPSRTSCQTPQDSLTFPHEPGWGRDVTGSQQV